MQSVKEAQYLNITSLFALFELVSAASVFGTVTVPLASMYRSLKSYKLDLSFVVLNLT